MFPVLIKFWIISDTEQKVQNEDYNLFQSVMCFWGNFCKIWTFYLVCINHMHYTTVFCLWSSCNATLSAVTKLLKRITLLPQKLSDQWKESGWVSRSRRRGDYIQATLCPNSRHFFFHWWWHRFFPQSSTMIHPLIIAIMSVNTSLTVVYWGFILGDAYYKWLLEPEDKPKKVVTPAWGSRHGSAWMSDWMWLFLLRTSKSASVCSAFCRVNFLHFNLLPGDYFFALNGSEEDTPLTGNHFLWILLVCLKINYRIVVFSSATLIKLHLLHYHVLTQWKAGDSSVCSSNPAEDYPKHVAVLPSQPHSEGHIHFTPLVFLDLRLFLFMEHVFYYGLHPVSWFILIANVAVTTIEWQFLIRQFYKLSTGKEEPTAPAASSSWPRRTLRIKPLVWSLWIIFLIAEKNSNFTLMCWRCQRIL